MQLLYAPRRRLSSVQSFLFATTILLTPLVAFAQATAPPPIIIEAESGTIGGEFETVTDGAGTYIAITTDYDETTGDSGRPGDGRTAHYEVTFPEPGTYVLYARVYVGSQAFDDDSFFAGGGFGDQNPESPGDWRLVNGLAGAGYTDASAYVDTDGTVGSEVWKWVRITDWAIPANLYVVPENELVQDFAIGARENGLRIDRFAFGLIGVYYTVSNLDNGEPGVTEFPDVEGTLVVDLSSPIGPVTHAASGALYGVTQTIPADVEEFVAPLNSRMYVQPARSGSGHQQPFGEALPVAERLVNTSADVTIRLPDINPGWPYLWPGWETWEAEVRSVIAEKLASGLNNIYGYEIWNEQHGTWNTNNGDFFADLWKPTYDLIRELDPDARIIGPSDAYYQRSRLNEFLTFCIANDCLPDVISWHELGGADNVSINIDSYRSLEASLGVSARPISINEYSDSVHEYEGAPGVSAPFIARFERKGVESAAISWWFTNLPGRLGSLLTASNQRGGGWWFYKWYGDMTGTMVSVTPPSESGDGVDGFANLDLETQSASVCFGGNYTGNLDVLVSGIPETFGDSVDVRVEYVPWTDKDTPVDGPVIVSRTTYDASTGSIAVPVVIENPLYGYRVYVTPQGVNTGAESPPIASAALMLGQNYPNPFSSETQIRYHLPAAGPVKIEVYDALGRRVAELVNERQTAGEHQIDFDARDLPAGLYYYRLTTLFSAQAKAMVLIR